MWEMETFHEVEAEAQGGRDQRLGQALWVLPLPVECERCPRSGQDRTAEPELQTQEGLKLRSCPPLPWHIVLLSLSFLHLYSGDNNSSYIVVL